jgi:hypothetical protein
MLLTAERLVEIVERKRSETEAPLAVFWYCVTSGRDQYQQEINRAASSTRMVTLVLRGDGFTNPNALMSDLNRLLCEHRGVFEAMTISDKDPTNLVTIILLSKSEFSLPQTSSPAVLPDWFPVLGGRTTYVVIDDLARSADAMLDAPEARANLIGERLFELERVLIRRLVAVSKTNPSVTQDLFDAIRNVGSEQYRPLDRGTWIEGLQKFSSLQKAESYRPSVSDKGLISYLLILTQAVATDQLPKNGEKLVKALGIDNHNCPKVNNSLFSTLFRPTRGDSDDVRKFGRNIIVTIYGASQFVTSAHHAKDYGSYPLLLLRYMSYDLRNVIDNLIREITLLE